ncbi:uncharacterized protein DEA37_0013895 [Paragonimus westermani]|uniref:Uncharacterized protein n=1 Tax=Paragonimus westermani TaxID=34504 RepID=A0A5J4N4N5_9TREM|nr:uncharacterized protein DEA37_0013895 [Paragonimus westermani]
MPSQPRVLFTRCLVVVNKLVCTHADAAKQIDLRSYIGTGFGVAVGTISLMLTDSRKLLSMSEKRRKVIPDIRPSWHVCS